MRGSIWLVRCKLAAELSRAGFFFGTYAWRRITSGGSSCLDRSGARSRKSCVSPSRAVMADPYQPVQQNGQIQVTARTWNGLLKAGQDYSRRKYGTATGGVLDSKLT